MLVIKLDCLHRPYQQTIAGLDRPARDQRSSLLQTFVNYGGKKFNNNLPMPLELMAQSHTILAL
jgi:hypothetical protein